MKERPILFNAPMVRAVLDGRKTVTRRPCKLTDAGHVKEPGGHRRWHPDDPDAVNACPFGVPGDRLYVRETWQAIHGSTDLETGYCDDILHAKKIPKDDGGGFWVAAYAATDPEANEHKDDRAWPWRPSIHMPRWASRILLEVASVRVKRIKGITSEDIGREGMPVDYSVNDRPDFLEAEQRDAFRELWDAAYFKSGLGWSANPWVWVVGFKVL